MYMGNCNGMVHCDKQTVYTHDNVSTSKNVIDNKVECSKAVVPESIYSVADSKALVDKVNTIQVDALNPNFCNHIAWQTN